MNGTLSANGEGIALNNAQASNFDWITDKNLLRDEGVYYGLSESNDFPEEKVRVIRQYFEEQIQVSQYLISSKEATVDRLEKEQARIQSELSGTYDQILQWETDFHFNMHDFWRYLIGLSAYAGMLVFNFWLIYNWLLLAGTTNPFYTALAVYLFGAFSLFNRLAVVYSSTKPDTEVATPTRESWKTLVEEIVIPIVAASYLVYKGWGIYTPVEVGLFFLVVLFVFLFAGKGFLNIWIVLKKEYSIFYQNIRRRKIQKEKIKQARQHIMSLNAKIAELKELAQKIEHELAQAAQTLALQKEQKETNVALFLSEVELARSTRNALNRKQLSQLISSRR